MNTNLFTTIMLPIGLLFLGGCGTDSETAGTTEETNAFGYSRVKLAEECNKIGTVIWRGDGDENNSCIVGGDEENLLGCWYSYNDDYHTHYIEWPEESYAVEIASLDGVVDVCNGICGDYKLVSNSDASEESVGLGMALPGNISEWGGICLAYVLEGTAYLYLDIDDTLGKDNNRNSPRVLLPSMNSVGAMCFTWDEFIQDSLSTIELSGEAVASNFSAFRIQFNGLAPDSGKFNIMAFGSYNIINEYAPAFSEITWNDTTEADSICATLDSAWLGNVINGEFIIPDSASLWEGVCVYYHSSRTVNAKISLGDSLDNELNNDIPFITLTKSEDDYVQCNKWSDFEQTGISGVSVSQETLLEKMNNLQFIAPNASDSCYEILGVGPYRDLGGERGSKICRE